MPGANALTYKNCHQAAADRGEPANHQRVKFAACHPSNVRLDHQWRFGVSDQNVGSHRQTLRPRDAQRLLHHPCHAADQ